MTSATTIHPLLPTRFNSIAFIFAEYEFQGSPHLRGYWDAGKHIMLIPYYDEPMKQICKQLIEEIGPLSKSYIQSHMNNPNNNDPCRVYPEATGSGKWAVTDCARLFTQIETNKAAIIFSPAIEKTFISLFTELAKDHPKLAEK